MIHGVWTRPEIVILRDLGTGEPGEALIREAVQLPEFPALREHQKPHPVREFAREMAKRRRR